MKTWLFRYLKNKIADYYRSKYKQKIEVGSYFIDTFFDEDHCWKPEYRPPKWGDEKSYWPILNFQKRYIIALKNFP